MVEEANLQEQNQIGEVAENSNAANGGATVQDPQPYASKYMVDSTLHREYFSVAPMVDVSDKYFRYFMRLLTKHAWLYTEMVNENAVLHACQGRDRLLSFSDNQHPVVCQIGGSDPVTMSQAAKVAQEFGYDEVNVNCGCPSNKVVKGAFGAILMKDPHLVARIVAEMRTQVTIPVTVKCRLGVDDLDTWDNIVNFVRIVSMEGGCSKFIIHARKAHLKGLNPKQNRTIPPLKYPWVFQLKQTFPHLHFVINGGFADVEKVQDVLRDDHPLREYNGLEGCMSGRMAMNTPWEVAKIDRVIYGETETSTMTREEILLDYADYAETEQDLDATRGVQLSNNVLVRPLITLFASEYQGVQWRKMICDTAADKKNAGQIKKVITEVVAKFKEMNPEGMAMKNGEKVIKPQWQLQEESQLRKRWSNLTEEEKQALQAQQREEQKQGQESAKTDASAAAQQDDQDGKAATETGGSKAALQQVAAAAAAEESKIESNGTGS